MTQIDKDGGGGRLCVVHGRVEDVRKEKANKSHQEKREAED